MDDRLLVCSVFAGGELDTFWFNTQRQFLDHCGTPYVHAIYLGQRANPAIYPGSTIIGQTTPEQMRAVEHRGGLRVLADYCRANPHRAYLFLDSDAWPCEPQWEPRLTAMLAHFKKRIAAAVRFENLDMFTHPCIVYTTDPDLLRFEFVQCPTLMGEMVGDTALNVPGVLPLVRTNRVSLHPILASVYADCFYHHGAGSRAPRMRGVLSGYYDHILPHTVPPDELLRRLQADPAGFVAGLRWVSGVCVR
jgi:hypothetical protein